MFNWSTFILSIIGTVTGSIGTVLGILKYISDRPKIKCELDDVYDSYWEHGKDIDTSNLDKYIAEAIKNNDVTIFSLQVTNTRKSPITLLNFYYKGYLLHTNINVKAPSFKLLNFEDAETGNPVYVVLTTQDSNKEFPLRLEGFDTVKIKLILVEEKGNTKARRYKLTLRTPFKNFKYKFKIYSAKHVALHKKIGLIQDAEFEKRKNQK